MGYSIIFIRQPHAATGTYTPPQVAKLYDFPTSANGTGECIALIELGGGFKSKDLQTYFQQLGIALPKVTSVDGLFKGVLESEKWGHRQRINQAGCNSALTGIYKYYSTFHYGKPLLM
jgi:hypothetical protein